MKSGYKYMIILHILLGVYSLTGVASKFAAGEEFMSFKFILFYGLSLFGLFIYAFVWQQIIKHMPLITAYANKGVTVIWGILWGYFIFSEEITIRKIIGAVIIIAGIVLIVTADEDEGVTAVADDVGENNAK
ncbi:MAG: EamA family transporter [Lachnospiraceae bacterium]|nr:EamA family transporter [Lachnospiraceae bacterium]